MQGQQVNTLIIGASISGLACAASLRKHELEFLIIEKESKIATPWRNHYERLHLHTNKRISSLPYLKFQKHVPKYPSRIEVINYLEEYASTFGIQPAFNTKANLVRKEGEYWITQTNKGEIKSSFLIMATGAYGKPVNPAFQGMETFPGKILHSSEYKSGGDFKGKNILVVGFGNSACEIAIDLYEQGAFPSMAVRSAVNVIPRDVMGIPILELSLLMRGLSPRLADKLNAPLLKLLVGDFTKFGLKKLPYGPLEQIQKTGTVPVLDIGTVKHIRQGHIKVYADIDHIHGRKIHFKDGKSMEADAIVAAIGYTPNSKDLLNVDHSRIEDLRHSINEQQFFGKDGLYFCGYWVSPTGQIREIGRDAIKIASDIGNNVNKIIGAGYSLKLKFNI